MQLLSVEGNTQRLDGGSMFGNCPRVLWERWCPPDDQHRIRLACRSLLVREDSGRNVLLEAGIGSFFSPKLRDRFGVQEAEHVLSASLAKHGLEPQDVDVIVLSHLHFDHAGGLLMPWQDGRSPQLMFQNASYVVGENSWARANAPHPRDRASFIPELQGLISDTARVEIVADGASTSQTLGQAYRFHFSDGHTPGLMLTRVETGARAITFMGDLIPGTPWVHLPITMGYDRYPELLIEEKQAVLEEILADDGWLFFTHDPDVAACRVQKDEKGKFRPLEPVSALSWA